MCQHALCEHGKDGSEHLLPQPPSHTTTIISILTCFILPLSLFYLVCRWIPLIWLATSSVGFIGIILYNMFLSSSIQLTQEEKSSLQTSEHADWLRRVSTQTEQMKWSKKLSDAIQVKTVSHDAVEANEKAEADGGAESSSATKKSPSSGAQALREMHLLLAKSFPLVHKHLEKTVVNEFSLLFKWSGSSSSKSKPYILCAHLDVVPVLDQHLWTRDAFGGEISEGYIHGRGAIDDKQSVCGILSAIEDLISTGFVPKRDMYVALGHDEEIGGNEGAAYIAKVLKERKIHAEFLLDEGLFVMSGILPGLKQQVALVCIAEKGFLINELKASVPAALAGHASTPGRESAIGILSRALIKMEQNPMPAYLIRGTPVRLMFESLAPHFHGVFRLLFTNLWLFAPLLKWVLTRKNTTATMVRTTTALTVFNAGSKANVVPREATALINHRIHPRDSIDGVMAYSKSVVSDERVTQKIIQSIPPAPVSSSTSAGFQTIKRALGRTLPDVLVAPALMVGNTDTFRYWDFSDDIYRFSPTRLTNENVSMFHGANEKIRVENYIETIGFYRAVIQIADENAK